VRLRAYRRKSILLRGGQVLKFQDSPSDREVLHRNGPAHARPSRSVDPGHPARHLPKTLFLYGLADSSWDLGLPLGGSLTSLRAIRPTGQMGRANLSGDFRSNVSW